MCPEGQNFAILYGQIIIIDIISQPIKGVFRLFETSARMSLNHFIIASFGKFYRNGFPKLHLLEDTFSKQTVFS